MEYFAVIHTVCSISQREIIVNSSEMIVINEQTCYNEPCDDVFGDTAICVGAPQKCNVLRNGVYMENAEKYEKALAFATEKHKGQFRIGGEEYITHPAAVARMVREDGYSTDYQITALFHDLLEDTDATEQEIEELGGARVLEAVKLLTKENGYIMAEYVGRIRTNPMAFVVKAADRLHNLRSAFCTSLEFRKDYIEETLEWYMDFSPEIPKAVKALMDSMPQDDK